MKFKRLADRLRRCIPRALLPIPIGCYRLLMRINCAVLELTERSKATSDGSPAVPPASLRYRVHGDPSSATFLAVGEHISHDVLSTLEEVNRPIHTFQHVLDFGCGCGRTLQFIIPQDSNTQFSGTDIDQASIQWCQSHIPNATFNQNDALPPLPYEANTFDLCYAISVFSHLDEDYQFQWLEELQRITQPKGLVLLSIHGQACWEALPYEDVKQTLREQGFLFVSENTWKGIFPAWYQTAYHTERYVQDRYATYFDVVQYIPKRINGFQDLVVLKNRG